MMHAVAQGAFFLYKLVRRVMAVLHGVQMDFLNNIMLVSVYHILACYKTEQQCPRVNNMISAFFHNRMCYCNAVAKIGIISKWRLR